MNRVFHAMRSDMRRAFCSWGFGVAVLGTFLLCFFSIFVTEERITSVLDGYCFIGTTSVQELVLILCAVPYAICFCSDWRNNYIRPSVMRTSPGCYAVSKCIACACAGGAALFLGRLLFVLALMLKYPMADANGLQNMTDGAYQSLLSQHNYFLFLVLVVLVDSLQGTFFSLLALCISTWIPNVFVALFSPLLAFYFVINLFSGILKIPVWLRFELIFNNYFALGGMLTTFLYQLFFALVICIIFTLLFVHGVKRRLSDG